MSLYVKKNDGRRQPFSLSKLTHSISDSIKDGKGAPDMKLAERLSHEAMEHLEGSGKQMVESDDVRQAVIHVLTHDGQKQVVDAYEMFSLRLPHLKIHQVIKRDGRRENVHPFKLFKAIKKSFRDAQVESGKHPETLMKEIFSRLEKNFAGKAVPIEEIRRETAKLLKEKGFDKVEKAYLLHKYL